jgi:hypothetical protein
LDDRPKLIASRNDAYGGSEAVAHIEFEHNTCVGEVKLSWLSKYPCEYLVKCEMGTIEGDVYDYESVVLKTGSGRRKRIKLESVDKDGIALRMVTNFIGTISENKKPLITGRDVLDSIELIDECYEAATRFDMPWYSCLEV